MKKIMTYGLICGVLATSAIPALARDTLLNLPWTDVFSMPEAQKKLDGSIKFFFSGQETPKILKKMGEGVSNRKTSGFAKSDENACKWAALSALIAFQDSAKKEGANAVVDLVGYYKRNETQADKLYECHVGALIVGVTLKGNYAQIEE